MKYELGNAKYGRHIERDIYEGDDFAYHENKYVCRCCEEVKPLNTFGVCESCYTSSMEHLVRQVKENIGDFFSDTEIDGGWHDDIIEDLVGRI